MDNDNKGISEMVCQIEVTKCPQILQADLAAEFPVYIYWSEDKSTLLHSRSLLKLLNDPRIPKPLKISSEGMSFLLQSGVVPPPKSAYECIYILGVGDKAVVTKVEGKIEVCFSHLFPFINENRHSQDEMTPDENLILQMIAEATLSRLEPSMPSFLFHSAGKDSNSIALAIAEAGWQDKITLISHKSKGAADESEISSKIAKKLGFKHRVLHEIDSLENKHYSAINEYFRNATLPSVDNVTLAYPLYAYQYPDLKGANIIDGGGNDAYMMTPLSKKEKVILPLAKYTSKMFFLRSYINSESWLLPLLRTPAEWCGMSGLSPKDLMKLSEASHPVHHYWNEMSESSRFRDLIEFKTDILTSVVAAEMHIRKARTFADSVGSNLVLPFANERLARYFAIMPENYLVDRVKSKNKLILRKILMNRIGLDSDEIGKKVFTFDLETLAARNKNQMIAEIRNSQIWPGFSEKVLKRLQDATSISGRKCKVASQFITRLYMISGFFRRSKYLLP